MKKGFNLIGLIIVVAIIGFVYLMFFTSLHSVKQDANYLIRYDGDRYYVESYTKENQGRCVYLAELETRLCGDWSVEKLLKEEE